jgi:hypothetical protein
MHHAASVIVAFTFELLGSSLAWRSGRAAVLLLWLIAMKPF